MLPPAGYYNKCRFKALTYWFHFQRDPSILKARGKGLRNTHCSTEYLTFTLVLGGCIPNLMKKSLLMNTLYFSIEFSQELMHPEMQVDIKLNIINVSTSWLERRFLELQTSTAPPLYPRNEDWVSNHGSFCFFSLWFQHQPHQKSWGDYIVLWKTRIPHPSVFHWVQNESTLEATKWNSKKEKYLVNKLCFCYKYTYRKIKWNKSVSVKKSNIGHFLLCTFPFFFKKYPFIWNCCFEWSLFLNYNFNKWMRLWKMGK